VNVVGHFGIEFLSDTPDYLIDKIKFTDVGGDMVISIFTVEEFPVFIKFFAQTLLEMWHRLVRIGIILE
jgi:hypothetical protein